MFSKKSKDEKDKEKRDKEDSKLLSCLADIKKVPQAAAYDDKFLLKFAIARQGKSEKAVKMFVEHMAFRQQRKLDSVLEEYFGEELPRVYISGFTGVDRHNNPIYIERPGLVNAKEMFTKFSIDFLVRWHLAIMETGRKRYTETGGNGICLIMDVTGMSMASATKASMKFMRTVSKIDQDNYPEHLAHCFIINASKVFTNLYRLACTFIDDRTKEKIKVLGEDYKGVLFEAISPDQLPKCFGGTLPDDGWWGKKFGSEDPARQCAVSAAPAGVADDDNDPVDEEAT